MTDASLEMSELVAKYAYTRKWMAIASLEMAELVAKYVNTRK